MGNMFCGSIGHDFSVTIFKKYSDGNSTTSLYCSRCNEEAGSQKTVEGVTYTYDSVVDIHYITLQKGKASKQIETTAILDVDKKGNILGIEVFGINK